MDLRPRYLMWVNLLMFFLGFGLVFAGAYAWAEAEAEAKGSAQEIEESATWEDRLERSTPDVRDSSLAAAVSTALNLEPRLSGYPLTVSAFNEVVFVQGEVATQAQRERAVAAARETAGVRDVKSKIGVVPGLKPQPQNTGEQRAGRLD